MFLLGPETVDMDWVEYYFKSGLISVGKISLITYHITSLFMVYRNGKIKISDSFRNKMISASEWDLGVQFTASKIEEETKCQSIEVENLSNAEPIRIGCFKDGGFIK